MTREKDRGIVDAMSDGAEKKPREGRRVKKVTTEVLVPKGLRQDSEQEFVGSSEVPQKVEEILDAARENLPVEVVSNIRDQYERAITRGLRMIEEKKEQNRDFDPSKARGSLYSAKVEMLIGLVSSAIENAKRGEREARLIPELATTRTMREKFDELLQNLTSEEELIFASMDLDNFKQVNDKAGHQAGDHVLRSFGISLFRAIRPEDIAGHFSGDEFGLIMKIPRGENVDTNKILGRIVASVQSGTERPVLNKDGKIETQEVSVGYVRINSENKDQIDFEMVRELSDKASAVSKLLDILSIMNETEMQSSGRIIDEKNIESTLSYYPLVQREIASIVRGINREMQGMLSVKQMIKMAELVKNGEMEKILDSK